jgi:hypothetical protein
LVTLLPKTAQNGQQMPKWKNQNKTLFFEGNLFSWVFLKTVKHSEGSQAGANFFRFKALIRLYSLANPLKDLLKCPHEQT